MSTKQAILTQAFSQPCCWVLQRLLADDPKSHDMASLTHNLKSLAPDFMCQNAD